MSLGHHDNEILDFYKGEILDAAVYAYFSKNEKDAYIRSLFKRLSEVESTHAQFWKEMLEKEGTDVRNVTPSKLNIFKVKLFRKLFGLGISVKTLEGNEDGAIIRYYNYYKNSNMDGISKSKLKNIVVDELVHETFFLVNEKDLKIDSMRDAIYGISDGLVEILAAVSGFAGLITNSLVLLMSGIIVGIAGTISMSAGAYISAKSQAEMDKSEETMIKRETEFASDELEEKFMDLLRSYGIVGVNFDVMVNDFASRKDLSKFLVDHYLGSSKKETSAIKSAEITALSYFIGALVPLIPYIFMLTGFASVAISFVLSAFMLSVVGYLVAITSGIKVWKKITEFVFIGIGAATLTYALGVLARTIFHLNTI